MLFVDVLSFSICEFPLLISIVLLVDALLLSDNQFTGEIPTELGNLVELGKFFC